MNTARLSLAQADCLAEMGITVWWSQALPSVQAGSIERVPAEEVPLASTEAVQQAVVAVVPAVAAPVAGAGKQVWGRPNARLLLMLASPQEVATPDIILKGRPGPLLTAMLASAGVAVDDLAVGLPDAGGAPLSAPLVLLVGERACQAVLGVPLAQARGRRHTTAHGPAVVCDLPANLRSSAALKRLAWDDMRILAAALAAL